MENSIAQALVPYDNNYSMVLPLAAPDVAKQAIDAYEALKSAIVREDDKFIYGSGDKARTFLKKSFWRRVAACFGLTLELVSEERGFQEQGKLFYSVMYRAVAPNGRTMIGDGYCSTDEKGHESWPEHTVRATAHTRAKNRAISDLVGGGEVSAEEMPDEEPVVRPVPMKQRYATVPAVRELPEPAPKPAADKMSFSEFAEKLKGLGMTPKAAMAELGVKTLSGLDLRQAYNRLNMGVVAEVNQEPMVDEISLQTLRLKAKELGYSIAQRDQLFEDCHNDPKEIASALEYARLNDLQSLGAGAKGIS